MRVFDMDGIAGWKHAYITKEDKMNLKRNDQLVVVGKNVFSWLESMHRCSYNVKLMKENHTLSSFIRAPYELNCNDDVPDTVKRYYGHKCYSENASNLIKLRTKKYRNWLDLENWWDPLPIPIYVNYENVLKNPELTIKELFYKYKFKINYRKTRILHCTCFNDHWISIFSSWFFR